MKAAISDGMIYIWQTTPIEYKIIREWNGMRWNRQKQALVGPASLENLNNMTSFGKLPEAIEAERQRLQKTSDAVEYERSTDVPVPMIDYPVKAKLFMHQIRACNMALLTFGFDPYKGDFE